ncbi:MAG: hypothetical protein UW11_C0034G0006 [Parcubacteria group bacterium GW2011_GWA2_43_9b]|uniref:Uncharacterized protein n=1 Tax=Candidatus Portnoybacteria bacterium RIFCSPLOWO2_02_FULL_39_11 TaxID=1802001 RepID=A0A1G2FSF7_9BACT|nr:MAG: hypothetical protein UW11_C0034G0006 [Parcubacteria group bacterium GW2011_GWA2_43_9b]OGZ41015.1 MAG: hypothetical protein A3B04_01700 [Candidatus Portnoybacteria bacterium RIFCSPLOWO2_02_FULL_39_11]
MKIFVKVKPDGYEEKIERVDETHFIAETKEPPVQNRANRAITRLLARYFNVELGKVRMIKGFRERNKIFEINL